MRLRLNTRAVRATDAGFTIVELLVALTVTGLVIGIMMNFMLNNLVQSSVQSAHANLLRESQQTLDLVANDIQLSANADQNNRWPDANAPSAPLNTFSWASNSTTLVLATAATTSSKTIIFSDPLKYITQKNNIIYFVQNKTLYKRTVAASVAGNGAKTSCPKSIATSLCPADKELVHDVSSFSVNYLDGDNQSVTPSNARSIELTLKLSAKTYRQVISETYTTRMVFRND